jgi:metal-responsive CopG/Arc/MetJ family transcriptional regulator
MKRRRKIGRPKMFESAQLLHIRLPEALLSDVEEATRLLAEPSVTQLIRRAVREFLDTHEEELRRRRKRAAEKAQDAD